MDPEVIKSLLPDATSREARLLERVWNRGKNVLRVAVENGVHKDAIEAILKVGESVLDPCKYYICFGARNPSSM